MKQLLLLLVLAGCAAPIHEQWTVTKPIEGGMTNKIVDCILIQDVNVSESGQVTGAIYECQVEGW
jgi:hypothetical protein